MIQDVLVFLLLSRFYFFEIEAQNITTGEYHSCAITSTEAVYCWGLNSNGQIGDGTTDSPKLSPVTVSGLNSGVTAIAAGDSHTCVIKSGGAVFCWGKNDYGQVGDGTTASPKNTAVAVLGMASGVIMITGAYLRTCAITSVGAMFCWGINDYGQIGDGTTTTPRPNPTAVSGMSTGVSAIASGYKHTCAVKSGGAYCWGGNDHGQVGDGTNLAKNSAVAVLECL